MVIQNEFIVSIGLALPALFDPASKRSDIVVCPGPPVLAERRLIPRFQNPHDQLGTPQHRQGPKVPVVAVRQ